MRKATIPPTAVIEPNTMPRIAPTLMTGAEGGPPGVEVVPALEVDCAEVLVPVAGTDVLNAVVDTVGEPSVSTTLESARFAFWL